MLAPQFILTKFQELIELSIEGRPDAPDVMKKMRDFNRYFQLNNGDPMKGLEYFKMQHQCFLVDVPANIQEKLNLPYQKMIKCGHGLLGLYNSFMFGMIEKRGFITKEGFKSLNYLIQQCTSSGFQAINEYLQQINGVHLFKELAIIMLKNTYNLNLINHLLENGIVTSSHSIDINNLTLGQSAQLIDQLNSILSVEISQVLYHKPNASFHRLVLLNSSHQVSCFSIFIENEDDKLNYYLLYDSQKLKQNVKRLVEELERQTEYLIENNQLQILSEYQIQNIAQKMRNQILKEESTKQCLKCQNSFIVDVNSISGQISNFCQRCYKDFQI